jgi:hypothetical protein
MSKCQKLYELYLNFDLKFDIDLTFACLREAPPCGAKAGICNLTL